MHRVLMKWFPENRQFFGQYVNTLQHTINNIVNTTDIDNIIDSVRSAIHTLYKYKCKTSQVFWKIQFS